MEFKDLVFYPNRHGGFGCHIEINGFVLSVQASATHYCEPREKLDSVDEYRLFEIAIWESDGDRNWVTKNFFPDNYDDVVGYQSREDINKLIENLENYK